MIEVIITDEQDGVIAVVPIGSKTDIPYQAGDCIIKDGYKVLIREVDE